MIGFMDYHWDFKSYLLKMVNFKYWYWWYNLDLLMYLHEFNISVTELTNDKSPGLNNVPPNAFKAMTQENLIHFFELIIEFWEDRLDFTEWHEGKVVPVPKSGDLSDTKKWRGVNLMDIGAKLFSSMMCKRLFKIIKLYGCPT